MKKYRSVDDYLVCIPVNFRSSVEIIRASASHISDALQERISYNTLFLYWHDRPIMYFNFSKNRAYLGFYRGALLSQHFPELQGDTKLTRSIDLPEKITEEFSDLINTIIATAIEVEISIKNGDPITF